MRTAVEREAARSTKFTKLIALALKKTSCSSESRGASPAIIFVSNLRSCYPSLLNYNPLVCVNETHDIFTESRKLSRVENSKFLPWFQRSHGHKYRPESNKSTVLIGYFTWRVESAGNSCNYHAWPPTRLGPSVLPAQVDTLSLKLLQQTVPEIRFKTWVAAKWWINFFTFRVCSFVCIFWSIFQYYHNKKTTRHKTRLMQ